MRSGSSQRGHERFARETLARVRRLAEGATVTVRHRCLWGHPCGCPILCRGWSGSLFVFVDETATSARCASPSSRTASTPHPESSTTGRHHTASTLPSVATTGRACRVIPACAGNRLAPLQRGLPVACHPCVCGEQRRPVEKPSTCFGSSLRVRGTGRPRPRIRRRHGVIPACAWNSSVPTPTASIASGHPCVCGDRSSYPPKSITYGGHPCVCGEQVAFVVFMPPIVGSSLRVRGTRCHWPGDKSSLSGHPCVCGEQPLIGSDSGVAFGSSLRVRGTEVHVAAAHLGQRVIPACAGNRRYARRLVSWRTGHPCVCGEQLCDVVRNRV